MTLIIHSQRCQSWIKFEGLRAKLRSSLEGSNTLCLTVEIVQSDGNDQDNFEG